MGTRNSTATLTVVLIMLRVVLVHPQCSANLQGDDFLLNGIDTRIYAKPGDINIGAIMQLTHPLDGFTCSEQVLTGSTAIEYTESIAFVVEQINNRNDLLPNVTLGFAILNDCALPSISLAQSLSFLPLTENRCHAKAVKNSSCYECCSAGSSHHVDVVGVLAPLMSVSVGPVSFLYTVAKIPIIAPTASSDEFSNKNKHPYFFRVIGPDKFQVEAMLNFISDNGWTYISVVYIEGTYGERAFDNIKYLAPAFNICLATWHRVKYNENTDLVAADLIGYWKARVIIAFMDEVPFTNLLTSVDKLNGTGNFSWIASDAVSLASSDFMSPFKRMLVGSFFISFRVPVVDEFYSYLERLNVLNSTNPWLKPAWESLNNCSYDSGTCNNSLNFLNTSKFDYLIFATLSMDVVLAFANAAHKLISDLCPNVTGKDVQQCVKSDVLYKYLKGESFQGYSGDIRFDENGDSIGKYVIYQWSYEKVQNIDRKLFDESEKGLTKQEVAYYDTVSKNITYSDNVISWDYFTVFERLIPIDGDSSTVYRPESVCSRPCVVGEYKIQKNPECCWDCRTCRNNERIINKNTACEECRLFTWPDPATNYTTCSPIPLTYQETTSVLSVLQISFAILALAAILLVSACYIHLRENRVIKAASRELSLLQIVAIFVGYFTVICFQTYPTQHMCSVLFFTYCLSFATLYSPLLVKTVRIYRIFHNATKSKTKPRFVSSQSQVIISTSLILIQSYIKASNNTNSKLNWKDSKSYLPVTYNARSIRPG
ncbi:metabotropic glutamate receptor 5-like [Physella acuta]|uniref:metabotropic glutamate receptor 5-like n=1 Tax=Physella acuta TaxID=109671 RepID=UPI0027DE4DCC|nr:metabotropic glutamate receptor 5-like [Physella acuta]